VSERLRTQIEDRCEGLAELERVLVDDDLRGRSCHWCWPLGRLFWEPDRLVGQVDDPQGFSFFGCDGLKCFWNAKDNNIN
jgi:hypothetical protein